MNAPMTRFVPAPTPEQAEAIDNIVRGMRTSSTVFALVGPAGSGKTFVTLALCDRLESLGYEVYATALTHRAAEQLSQALGSDACTVHSLFGLRVFESNSEKQQIKQDGECKAASGSVVLVDEASMAGSDLLRTIEDIARTKGITLVYIGDGHQLPPVGEINSPALDPSHAMVSSLRTVMRQALDSDLFQCINKARLCVEGEPFPEIQNCEGVERLDSAEWLRRTVEALREGGDALAIAYRNDRAQEINQAVRVAKFGQEALSQPFFPGETAVANSAIVSPFKREVVVDNNRSMSVLSVDPATCEFAYGTEIRGFDVLVDAGAGPLGLFVPAQPMTRFFKGFAAQCKKGNFSWSDFWSARYACADLRSAYASTVHKAQGATVRNAFVDLADINNAFTKGFSEDEARNFKARLAYTALSRASLNLTIMGDMDLPQISSTEDLS
jgi:hypothetical protein